MSLLPEPPPRASMMVEVDKEGKTRGIGTQLWTGWFRKVWQQFHSAFSGTIPLAKLTGGGVNGSIVVTNGIITKVVPPT